MAKKKINAWTIISAWVDLKLTTEYTTKLNQWKPSARNCLMKHSLSRTEKPSKKIRAMSFNQTIFRGLRLRFSLTTWCNFKLCKISNGESSMNCSCLQSSTVDTSQLLSKFSLRRVQQLISVFWMLFERRNRRWTCSHLVLPCTHTINVLYQQSCFFFVGLFSLAFYSPLVRRTPWYNS